MLDPAELTDWFEAHAAPLVLYARQWLDRGAAEDVVQEAFVRLMLQPRPPGNVKAWLYRTVRNEAISRCRSDRRRVERETVRGVQEAYFEPPASELPDADAAAAALLALPEPQREAIVLRIWGEMTLREISQLTNWPVSTAFHHYKLGLRAIRQQMGITCKTKKN